MNAGPYSDEKVQRLLEEHFIPIKSQCFWNNRTNMMKQFNVSWTPTLVVLDKRGQEQRRVVGYVPADDLLAHLLLGKAMIFFDTNHFVNAVEFFKAVIADHPHSGPAPEAVFFLGVAEYKRSHDPGALRKAYDTLQRAYSHSEWFRRAAPYGAIPA